ncbi:MAG: T9SS type A sorting domain-containing protein, partial [FCB group bacterium]
TTYAVSYGDGLFQLTRAKQTSVNTDTQISNDAVSIFPNPANTLLNINSADLSGKNISIYNMLGNKLLTATADGTAISINIESLPEGVYFIKIGEQTLMFVK